MTPQRQQRQPADARFTHETKNQEVDEESENYWQTK